MEDLLAIYGMLIVKQTSAAAFLKDEEKSEPPFPVEHIRELTECLLGESLQKL